MFYDRYILLCKKANKKPYSVAKELNLGSSNVAQWKKGSTPRISVIEEIAKYFDVSISYLLTGNQTETPAAENPDIVTGFSKLSPEYQQIISDLVDKFLKAKSGE